MNFYALSGLINGLATSALGIFIYFKNKRGVVNRYYGLTTVFISIWSYGYFFLQISTYESQALFWSRALTAGAIFIPPTYLHFVLSLLGLHRKKRKILIFAYILSSIFFILNFTPLFVKSVSPKLFFRYWPDAGIAYFPFLLLVYFSCIAYAIIIMFKGYKRSTGVKILQIKYVILGALLGFGGGATNYPLCFNIPMPPIGNILVSVGIGIMGWAIFRYRLMDIYITVRKTMIYGILGGFMVGIVALVTFAGQQYFAKTFAGHQWVLSLISVLIITTTFHPLQILLQKFVEGFIFHHRYEYRDALKAADKELGKVKSLRSLLVMTAKVISDTLAPDHTALFIKNRKRDGFEIKISKGKRKIEIEEIKSNNGLIHWLNKYEEPVIYEELKYRLESEDFTKRKEERKKMRQTIDEMERLNANACIPSFYKDKLAGGLILGNRASGNMYTQEDLDLLQSLANHTATVVDDLQLQKEKDDLTVDAIGALAKATEAKDLYTKGHSERVTQYAEEITEKLKNAAPFRSVYELEEKVHYAGLMHDVGKIGISDSILHKPSKLTEEEYGIIKEHPSKSAEIIGQIRDLDKDIIAGVLHHHERWDGRGYPKGLAGQNIPKIARILAVADAYDAMTTTRPYRKAFTIEEANEELKKNSGIQFDPQVVKAFL